MFVVIDPKTNEIHAYAENWFEASNVQTHLQKIWKTALIVEKVPS